ncbi:uncharacterized protein SOCE26_025000 [Sorangium cellulosum]|uniref:Uncharacterized protein n=1 Tax=Sorangium cellulosum TaxID=56 RepID=A0A2L0EP97_SORCE|nr:hypothetical protein [Sorangium cellulosum]AUX41095.1 uncharacterized protein SOCE26_025000 [Sorangium cellulosum]
MKRLRSVLALYVEPIHLGDAERAPLDVERLREQLRQVGRTSEAYFAVCVVMLMVLFVAALWAALRATEGTGFVKEAFAGLGVSMFGLIRAMLGLWREKVATDVLLTLAASLDSDTLRSVIAVLLKRLG